MLRITNSNLIHVTRHLTWKRMGKNEVEKTNKANIRKADFLAVSEACKDAFWPSPCVDLLALPSQHPGLQPFPHSIEYCLRTSAALNATQAAALRLRGYSWRKRENH